MDKVLSDCTSAEITKIRPTGASSSTYTFGTNFIVGQKYVLIAYDYSASNVSVSGATVIDTINISSKNIIMFAVTATSTTITATSACTISGSAFAVTAE